MPRDRRIQPSLGKYRPIRSPDRQMYRIRDMKTKSYQLRPSPRKSPYISPMSTEHYATSLSSTFAISSPQGREQLLISCSSSMSRRNTSATAEKQYMPRSKSLYAACDAKPLRHLLLCQPLRLRSALTYPEKKLLSASLYNFIG